MTNPIANSKRSAPAKPVKASTVKSKTAPPVAKTASAKPKPKPKLLAVAQDTAHTKAKHKLIRDSFTIPKSEYAVLEGLKARATDLKRPAKKGELLRSGIAALQAMSDKAFLSALAIIPSLKTGRPKLSDLKAHVAKGSAE